MRKVEVKRFRIKTIIIDAAILEVEPTEPKPEAAVIIARRDLIKLKRLFQDLDRNAKPRYNELKRSVKKMLDQL